MNGIRPMPRKVGADAGNNHLKRLLLRPPKQSVKDGLLSVKMIRPDYGGS